VLHLNLLEAFFLGLIQGITEFLPISSSAHLVIAQQLMGLNMPGLAFEVFLHFASLLAVLIYFRRDIVEIVTGFFKYLSSRQEQHRGSFLFTVYLLLATAITGVLGVLLEDLLADKLKSMTTIAISLFATGVFLFLIERVRRYGSRTAEQMTVLDALWIGLGQTVAVIPGISRAGSTLVVALWCGLEKETAVRFSFLLSVPVILGSTVLMAPDFDMIRLQTGIPELLISFAASFVFALIGIKWLITFLQHSKLIYFTYYCFFMSGFVFFFLR
jgi:undecaprenyl-diphosphatase